MEVEVECRFHLIIGLGNTMQNMVSRLSSAQRRLNDGKGVMEREKLELSLSEGKRWGFVKQTKNTEYLGWILLTKRKPPQFWPEDEHRRPDYFRRAKIEAERFTRTPYHIHIIELRKDVHESGTYDIDTGTRLKENFYFATLEDVASFLKAYSLELDLIQPAHSLNAP